MRGLIFFQHKMEVGAAEPERTHARTTWSTSGNPRAGFAVEIERGVGDIELGIGLLQINERGQHLVVQRKRGLDESGSSSGGFGVTDLRLDAAKSDRLCRHCGCGVNLTQSLKFRDIPGGSSGAMRFNEANAVRCDAGILIGTTQTAGLSGSTRGVDAFETPITGGADALEDGVDLIPVTLCIRESFEDHHAQAFADQDAFGFSIEGAHTIIFGERRCFAETHVHERGVVRVNSTCDHHVGAPVHEIVDRHLHRGK